MQAVNSEEIKTFVREQGAEKMSQETKGLTGNESWINPVYDAEDSDRAILLPGG